MPPDPDAPSGEDPVDWEEQGEWEQGDDAWDLREQADSAPASGRHRPPRVPLLTVPAALRSAQLGVGTRGVRGLLLLALVAVLVLAGRWLWTQRPAAATGVEQVAERSEDAVAPAGESTVQPAGDEPQEAAATPDPAQPTGTDLVVHVTGAVEEPGVVELPAGSRVVDAVRAAGGLAAEADPSSVNLARPLVDGEQLWVGRPGEEPPPGSSPPQALAQAGPGSGAAAGAGEGTGPVPLDLNAATQADLEELPGIGPVTAGRILAWRDEHGRFSRVDELLEVSGIGERTFAQLEPLVRVDG